MKVGSFSKQPGERISNSIAYDDALDEGDEVSSVLSCAAEPAGLTVTPVLASESRVRIWSEGGSDGTTYKITVTVLTAGGEIFEDELTCKVRSI